MPVRLVFYVVSYAVMLDEEQKRQFDKITKKYKR